MHKWSTIYLLHVPKYLLTKQNNKLYTRPKPVTQSQRKKSAYKRINCTLRLQSVLQVLSASTNYQHVSKLLKSIANCTPGNMADPVTVKVQEDFDRKTVNIVA